MNDERNPDAAPDPIKPASEPVVGLRLRSVRPRVTRLSRRVLTGGAAIALAAVSGAVFWALQNNRHRNAAPEELYSTDHRVTADGLAGLPRDYAGIPRQAPPLGPPLPGDLGRPMLSDSAASNTPIPAGPAVDPETQRRSEEIEAARLSGLFASAGHRDIPSITPKSASATAPDPGAASTATAPSTDAAFAQNGQDRKLAFVNASVDRRTTGVDRLEFPVSPYVVQAGTIISGALITGIRSDLPGEITAQVSENVFDTPTGKYLLIPQGARLIGQFDSSGSRACCWSGPGSSCRTANRLCWSGSRAPTHQAIPGLRTRSTTIGIHY